VAKKKVAGKPGKSKPLVKLAGGVKVKRSVPAQAGGFRASRQLDHDKLPEVKEINPQVLVISTVDRERLNKISAAYGQQSEAAAFRVALRRQVGPACGGRSLSRAELDSNPFRFFTRLSREDMLILQRLIREAGVGNLSEGARLVIRREADELAKRGVSAGK
jgi:hypothetical protein